MALAVGRTAIITTRFSYLLRRTFVHRPARQPLAALWRHFETSTCCSADLRLKYPPHRACLAAGGAGAPILGVWRAGGCARRRRLDAARLVAAAWARLASCSLALDGGGCPRVTRGTVVFAPPPARPCVGAWRGWRGGPGARRPGARGRVLVLAAAAGEGGGSRSGVVLLGLECTAAPTDGRRPRAGARLAAARGAGGAWPRLLRPRVTSARGASRPCARPSLHCGHRCFSAAGERRTEPARG